VSGSGHERDVPPTGDHEPEGRVGRFRWWSHADRVEWSEELFGVYGLEPREDLTLDVIAEVIPETDLEWVRRTAASVGLPDAPLVFWQRVHRPDGERLTVEVRAWAESEGVLAGTVEDVTHRIRMREERDRLHRQRELVLSATADGICGLDREGRITFLNAAAAAILGREDEVLLGERLHDLVHRAGDRETHAADACPFVTGAADGVPRRDRHDDFHRSDGTVLEAQYTMLPVDAPEMHGCVVSFRDITDHVRTERRLRRTLAEVRIAQEEERARIAGDIHDDTVQVMNAVALQLERVGAAASAGSELATRVEDVRGLVREATHRLRRLLFDLYPPDLAHGLPEAIMRYGEARGADAGFVVTTHATGTERLDDDERTLLYRLAQEALANVAAHARARRVDVSIDVTADGTRLRVHDDGVGFEPRVLDAGAPGHLGLTMLRQRTESAGGHVRLRSAPGRGTQIDAWLPAAGAAL
jgi:PAS domain S-box-containing protein